MSKPLQGVTPAQLDELRSMLASLSRLWSELTEAAASRDQDRVSDIQRRIAACRSQVEAIKRAGTVGSA